MRTFKDYLFESKKQYDFRVKIAGDITTEQENTLKSVLEKYSLSGFTKKGKTPIQELPLDFPQVKNCEVSIFEVVLDYPTTAPELTEYISRNLKINKQNIAVRRPGEQTEEYQQPAEKREGALLNDSEYKEAPNANFDEYYGDKYNSGFVKELNELLKLERKARGEKIPEAEPVKYNTDSDAGKETVLKQAQDPRRK